MVVLQYQTPETTPIQVGFAIAVLLAIGLVAAVVRLRMEWAGMDAQQRAHVQQVVGGILGTDPVTQRFDGTAIREGDLPLRNDVERLVARARGGETGQASATPVRVALAQAWRDVRPDLPAQVVRLGRLAILVAVFAPLAVSTQTLVHALQSDPGGMTLGALLTEAVDGMETVGVLAVDTAGAFPFAGSVWSLALALAITAGQWLYQQWVVVLAALVVVAVGLWWLDETDVWTRPDIQVVTPWLSWLATLGGLLAVWIVGAGIAALGSAAGVARIGNIAGFSIAALFGGWLATLAVRSRIRSVRERARRADGPSRRALAAIAARSAASTLVVIATPLAVAYAVSAVALGGGAAVVVALLAADPLIQTGVLVGLGAVAVAAGVLFQDARQDILSAARTFASRLKSRGALFVSVGPLLAGLLLYLGLSAAAPLPVALVVSVVAVLALRVVGRYANKARYAAALRESDPRTRNVFVEMWAVEDADGRIQHVADVGGTRMAHADSERFVDAVCEVVRIRAEGDKPGPMLERNYYERLTDHGIADPESIVAGEREYAREVIDNALRDSAGRPRQVDRDWFEEQVSEIPEEVLEPVLRELRGVDETPPVGDVSVTEETVALRSDHEQQRGVSSPRRVTG